MFFETVPDWEEWCLDYDYNYEHEQGLIERHLRAMQMREREGLQGFIGGNSASGCAYMKHIDALVMCYGALGDVQRFRLWVGRAREAKLAEGPGSAAHVKVLDMWLREPKKFHVWGWKSRR